MIRTYPDPILIKKSEEFHPEAAMSAEFLEATMKAMSQVIKDFEGLGLAAPQIGVSTQIICVSQGQNKEPKFYINPKVVDSFGSQISEEACLSLPGVLTTVKRKQAITITYLDKEIHENKEDVLGPEAIVLQHEIDHINGKTLMQTTSPALRGKANRDLKKGKAKLKKAKRNAKNLVTMEKQLQMRDKSVKVDSKD